jgi:Flp pilus assembly protein TadG
MTLHKTQKRSGAAVVEMAIVLPVMLLLVFALIIGGMGIFRYQQVANLAREGARYASVHGTQYALETGNAAATPTDVYNNAILPQVIGLDLSQLNYSVTWNASNSPVNPTNFETPSGNTVTVKVTYTWIPEWFFIGPFNLTSSSTVPMSY